jgi:hypothetical protein
VNPIFNNRVWSFNAPLPWRLEDCEDCVEITQPDGVGAMHISSARKQKGAVLDAEILSQLREDCPDGTEFEKVRCGDFVGYVGEYVDWHTDTFWKKWFVANRSDLLFITYNCKHGEEELEANEASNLLASIRSRV